jgi:uncharacterized surface protein with fasciclin (FAS1) repeats
MVDGGGTMAEIVEKDIGASNGVIQVINKVLGFPQDNVREKLRSDPMMTKTNSLGEQEHFNDQFANDDLSYTFLVPSDKAWDKVKNEFATAYKVLFMGPFSYQTTHVLERHMKVGAKLSIEELVFNETLDMLRGGPFKFSTRIVDGESVTIVTHDDREAVVVRANIECTNGYIHVIDNVIMKRRDVTLAGGSGIFPSLLAVASTYFLTFLLH